MKTRVTRRKLFPTLGFLAFYHLLASCTEATPISSNPHNKPAEAASKEPAARPNILLIVVDDMGFNDIGSFGSEIETPNLDQLANGGIRLTNFHVAPTCSPTRSMLLTGVDHHKTGLGNMAEELSPNQKGQPGYEGFLNDRVVTLATLLRDDGYRTMMTGKWHLGKEDNNSPTARGFEQSFSLLAGGASHYPDMRPAYAPSPDIKASYRHNGKRLSKLPEAFEYSSQYYVDHMINQLKNSADSDKPFFAYLAFTAPHWPLQAPDVSVAKFKGRYDGGYDQLTRDRLQQAKALGVLPENTQLSAPPPNHIPWKELSETQQRTEARAMEIYAAMIAELDQHSGRLFDYLRSANQLDNTIVVFLADNGAEGHDLDETWPAEMFPKIRHTIDTVHDFSYAAMGKPGSYTLYGPNWAWAGSPGFNLYKAFPTEGGTRTAAFIYYPQQFKSQAISHRLISVKDIAPTLLELTGVAESSNPNVEKITGVSQVSFLSDGAKNNTNEDRVLAGELFGKRFLRQGKWKISHMPKPYGNDNWQLFALDSDLGESLDVSSQYPEKKAELLLAWENYVTENHIILPDWVSGY